MSSAPATINWDTAASMVSVSAGIAREVGA